LIATPSGRLDAAVGVTRPTLNAEIAIARLLLRQ
jgi:hypothetical protein